MTKEAFKAQFPHKINDGGMAIDLEVLRPSEIMFGYKIYRAMEKLVLEDETGDLWLSSIPSYW